MGAEIETPPQWQRPAFEPGNGAAVTHGAYSDSLVTPRATELQSAIFAANPHLDRVRDGAGVWRYAMTMAKVDRIYAYLADQTDMIFADRDKGTVHSVHALLLVLEARADKAEERLAISPLTRAKLGLDKLRGIDLARQWAAEAEGVDADV